ncbi:photosystem I reaction center subunit VIII [Richelia sinica]|nr:photosystem I reaction center subunit VIII [Richelia sinica]MBD2662947.1 photosystem I reaction center subunit VIII [Richelia sinica FACHB-800]
MSSSFFPTLLAYTPYLSSLLLPLVVVVFPAAVFAFLFVYIEREDIA